jgi:uncharacterized protein (TIGR02147 family)
MMDRASAAIDLIPAADRDISSLTLCLGKNGLRRLKDRILRLRKELLELSVLEVDATQVVQVNFQLFPLTQNVNSVSRSGSAPAAKRKESRK